MKYKTWFYLCLLTLSCSVFGEPIKLDVINIARSFTLQEYQRLTEENFIKNHAGKMKDFKLTFKHLYERTPDIKMDENVGYACHQFDMGKNEGQCTLTTHYYIDPDCWSCWNAFEPFKQGPAT